MSGIKGVGTGVVDAILAERQKKGPFKDLYQFFKRVDIKRVGKKVIEDLVDAGCFDYTGWQRDALRQVLEPMFETAVREQKEAAAGVLSLFSLIGESSEAQFSKPPPVKNSRSRHQTLLKEKELLGFFLTGHPLDVHAETLKRLSTIPLSQIEHVSGEAVLRCAFVLESVQMRISSKSQKKFAITIISDGLERYELPIWPELYEENSHLLRENQMLCAVVHVDRRESDLKLTCKWLGDLSQVDEAMIAACDQAYDKAKFFTSKPYPSKPKEKPGKTEDQAKSTAMKNGSQTVLKFTVDAEKFRLSHILELKRIFSEHRGSTPMHLDFAVEGRSIALLQIDAPWGVKESPLLDEALKTVPHFSNTNKLHCLFS